MPVPTAPEIITYRKRDELPGYHYPAPEPLKIRTEYRLQLIERRANVETAPGVWTPVVEREYVRARAWTQDGAHGHATRTHGLRLTGQYSGPKDEPMAYPVERDTTRIPGPGAVYFGHGDQYTDGYGSVFIYVYGPDQNAPGMPSLYQSEVN